MYNMAKLQKTDMSESKNKKNYRNLQENVIKDYVIYYVITVV